MNEQTQYSETPVKEKNELQWYCPHRFGISGLQVGCKKGIWPMNCQTCEYGGWIETKMTTSSTTGIDLFEIAQDMENMDKARENLNLVEVYDINGHLSVGENIEEAIKAFRIFYPQAVIKKIVRIFGEDDVVGNALMVKEKK